MHKRDYLSSNWLFLGTICSNAQRLPGRKCQPLRFASAEALRCFIIIRPPAGNQKATRLIDRTLLNFAGTCWCRWNRARHQPWSHYPVSILARTGILGRLRSGMRSSQSQWRSCTVLRDGLLIQRCRTAVCEHMGSPCPMAGIIAPISGRLCRGQMQSLIFCTFVCPSVG